MVLVRVVQPRFEYRLSNAIERREEWGGKTSTARNFLFNDILVLGTMGTIRTYECKKFPSNKVVHYIQIQCINLYCTVPHAVTLRLLYRNMLKK